MENNKLLQAFKDNDSSVISGYCRQKNGKNLSRIAMGTIHVVTMNFTLNGRWMGQHLIKWANIIPQKESSYQMTGTIRDGEKTIANVFIHFKSQSECGRFIAQRVE